MPNYYTPQSYNPYFPTFYQGYQTPQIQQQLQQQQQSGILWVSGATEAQNYPVAPNNAVALWDSSRPAIYLKQADASGKPVLKTYDLVERTEMPQNAIPGKGKAETPDYVTRAEFDELCASVEEIKAQKRVSVRKKETDE